MIRKFATIALSSIFTAANLSAEVVDVYLLGGQSNMQGIGKLSEIKGKEFPKVNAHILFKGQFEPLIIGKTQTSNRAGELGPEIGFAMEMTNDKPIYLIKYAASGMPLDSGWNGNKWVGGKVVDKKQKRTNFYPGENAQDINQGRLYQAMLQRYRKGIEELKQQGHEPRIKGFLWMQGEQDSKNAVSARNYAVNLKLLRSRLAIDLGIKQASDLAFVYGQVLPYPKPMARFSHRDEVRQNMADADMGSGKTAAIARARMISTDNFPLLKDTVHYNANGQLMLGNAMAKAMKELANTGETQLLWKGTPLGFPTDYPHNEKVLDPEHITEVSQPRIRIFPAMGKPTGQAIVIFSGGGYRQLAVKKEADRVAAYYATRGITCFNVVYRVTRGNHPAFRYPGPLLDARKGIRLAKSMAKKYQFSADQVGVMGFSAGGHLAAMTATQFDDTFELEKSSSDSLIDISPRPAFAALIYPVASMAAPTAHGGSRAALFGKNPDRKALENASPELRVKTGYPEIFIAHNQFDPVDAQLSINLAKAYSKAKVPCTLHLFSGRDHGFGMGRAGQTEKQNPAIAWPKLLHQYLINRQK